MPIIAMCTTCFNQVDIYQMNIVPLDYVFRGIAVQEMVCPKCGKKEFRFWRKLK